MYHGRESRKFHDEDEIRTSSSYRNDARTRNELIIVNQLLPYFVGPFDSQMNRLCSGKTTNYDEDVSLKFTLVLTPSHPSKIYWDVYS